jgi:hypothetical protein
LLDQSGCSFFGILLDALAAQFLHLSFSSGFCSC